MKALFFVFLGGGLGSVCRYLISIKLNFISSFPWGTLVVNVLGCFLLGFLLGFTQKETQWNPNHMLLAATGFCGGFTTFSTFSQESISILNHNGLGFFLIYVCSSITLGFISFWLGQVIT